MKFRDERGLTYVEVLTAIGILLLLFTFISQMNRSVFNVQHQDQVKMQMLFFAQGALEEYLYDLQTGQTLTFPVKPTGGQNLPPNLSVTKLPAITSPSGFTEIIMKAALSGSSNQPAVYVTGYQYNYPF